MDEWKEYITTLLREYALGKHDDLICGMIFEDDMESVIYYDSVERLLVVNVGREEKQCFNIDDESVVAYLVSLNPHLRGHVDISIRSNGIITHHTFPPANVLNLNAARIQRAVRSRLFTLPGGFYYMKALMNDDVGMTRDENESLLKIDSDNIVHLEKKLAEAKEQYQIQYLLTQNLAKKQRL